MFSNEAMLCLRCCYATPHMSASNPRKEGGLSDPEFWPPGKFISSEYTLQSQILCGKDFQRFEDIISFKMSPMLLMRSLETVLCQFMKFQIISSLKNLFNQKPISSSPSYGSPFSLLGDCRGSAGLSSNNIHSFFRPSA